MIDRGKLADLLGKNRIGVISTHHDNGGIESAVVGFTETPELEFVVGTNTDSRKAKNIRNNPNVACVIGWDESITLQIEGVARELDSTEFDARYRELFIAKENDRRKYVDSPSETRFIITPHWMRYTELNRYPWHVEEEYFKSK